MTFKTKGRDEGCEPDDVAPGERVAQLCGIENHNLFYGNFMRPKIKVQDFIKGVQTLIALF